MYLDDVGIRRIQEVHQLGEDLGPASDRVARENRGNDGSEGVTDIGIWVSDMAKGERLDVLKDILPNITGVVLNVSLKQQSSDRTCCWEFLGHLSQDVDEVVVVVGNISERLELLLKL